MTRISKKRTPSPEEQADEKFASDSIVSFIDILGFRQRLKGGRTAILDAAKELEFFIDAFSQGTGKDKDLPPELRKTSKTVAFALSDAIVRAKSYQSHAPLFSELLSLTHCTLRALSKGVVVRGAITNGFFSYDESKGIVASEALLRAYELETQAARFPRIIIDPRLLREAMKNRELGASHHDALQDLNYIMGLLRRDKDGFFFLDYLRAARTELDDPQTEYPDLIKLHKHIIIKNLSKSDSPTILEKYKWLEDYHNSTIMEMNWESLMAHLITEADPWTSQS